MSPADPAARSGPQRLKALAVSATVLAAAALGGWGAHRLGLPLAWLTGALFVSAAFTFFGVRAGVGRLRPYGLVVLGLSLGQSFTPEILRAIAGSLPLITVCGFLTLGTGLLGARIFTAIAGTDAKTAFFCSVPGGVVLMAVHAQRAGASEPQVVLAQTIRLIAVVLIYPTMITFFVPHHAELSRAVAEAMPASAEPATLLRIGLYAAAGLVVARIGQRLYIPNPWMLAPCLMSICLSAFGAQPVVLPHVVVTVCQVILGVSLGTQMTQDFVMRAHRLVIASVLSALLLTLIMVPLALLVARLGGLDIGATLLGMAPGGMPEMTITAQSLGIAVPLVLSFHLVRILIGNLLIEPIWWLACRLGWAPSARRDAGPDR
ncbi:AbrB family transcriptional regulator [Salipiger abyssi]|uniref:AbrB family transcriptional regulator n=1 Tax=Salipiger abyssi TaxID=1250539 RepID=A0A1P8US33_9RHOB|nr:AbrB family transcriptional regulator [Salipiger abyssi]APZ52209.1 hypothetical protein Ga0080574_TMP1875 [Salipiger abyssi]